MSFNNVFARPVALELSRVRSLLANAMNPDVISPISSLYPISVESGVETMTTDSDAVVQGYLQKSPPLGKRGLKVCLCTVATTMSCALFVQRGRVTVHDTITDRLFVMLLRGRFFSKLRIVLWSVQCNCAAR